jgi:YfiR/HmsC-like
MELLKRKSLTTALVLMLVTLTAVTLRTVPAASSNEYELKSVFLYNFCHFIEWPNSAFTSPTEPFIIAVVGQDPFGSFLRDAIKGETYHDRPIVIQHFHGPNDIQHCHILFVGRTEANQVDAILEAITSKSVLTVGETEDFLDHGGMIALPAERNRVRLRMKPTTMRAANLSVSSKLLRVADIDS